MVSVAGQSQAVMEFRKGARAASQRIWRTIPFRMVRMNWAVSWTTAGSSRWMAAALFSDSSALVSRLSSAFARIQERRDEG